MIDDRYLERKNKSDKWNNVYYLQYTKQAVLTEPRTEPYSILYWQRTVNIFCQNNLITEFLCMEVKAFKNTEISL